MKQVVLIMLIVGMFCSSPAVRRPRQHDRLKRAAVSDAARPAVRACARPRRRAAAQTAAQEGNALAGDADRMIAPAQPM